MLTSFFGKSNPLNFLLVSGYIFIVACLQLLFNWGTAFTIGEIVIFLGVFGLLVFSLLVLDFTIRKNSLTLLNTYGIFVFSCSVAMLPEIFSHPALVIANLLLLFAFRRMFSLQSAKKTEIKILDASLWIGLASVFYFWSLLLVIVLYTAIFFTPQKSLRHYLITPLAWIALFVTATALHFLLDDSFLWFSEWIGEVSFDFSIYAPVERLIFITVLTVLLLWTGISKLGDINKGPRKDRPNHILQFSAVVAVLIIVAVSPEKNGAELLLLVAPVTIIISGYIEKKKDIWFKEVLLWSLLLLPLIFVFI